MKMRLTKSQRGFSLLELMIAATLGVLLILAMTSLFKTGMTTTFTVTQRAETQQNMRAAIELLTKDIGLAGSGLPTGGMQLPTAGGAVKVSCNYQNGTCYVPGGVYNANYMTGILPGFGNGVQNSAVIAAAPAATNDSITSIYCDYNFPLSNFTFAFPTTTTATATTINAAVTPNNVLAPGGLNVGDLMLFTVTSAGNGTTSQGTSAVQTAAAVGEITGLTPGTPPTITFAPADSLNFNQAVGDANSLAYVIKNSMGGGTTVTACRLEAVTYFLQVPAAGGTVQTPRLMRQVNALPAVAVADNIINLQFSYDVISATTGLMNANLANVIAAGDSPALIQKVNMWVMGQSVIASGDKSQSMYLASSVSTRNMSFCNSYSNSSTVCQ